MKALETVTVNISAAVEAEEGRDGQEVQALVDQTIREWFTGKLLGQRLLRARLGEIIYHCEGVANYTITAPAADVAVDIDQLPVLGTLKVVAKA